MATIARMQQSDLPFGPIPRRSIFIILLAFLTFMGAVAGIGRLLVGLGATTGLNDGYPWGIWIGFDFSLIALSGTGFTMAAVVHVLHLHQFQPALRPALLAGLCGYTGVLLLLVLDLGRPDHFYNFILFWNPHSPLFEISWCVLLYTTVLVVEVSPALFRRLGWLQFQRLADRLMAPITIIGVTLSTLHQSTLGTLYLNMPHRLDPRWYTPILPVLFFVSSVMAGLCVALIIYSLAARIHGIAPGVRIVRQLGTGAAIVALVYFCLKMGVFGWQGSWQLLGQVNSVQWLFYAEVLLGILLPVLLFLLPITRSSPFAQRLAALLMIGGVMLNRFDIGLFAQISPIAGSTYTPHIFEWISTLGIFAGAALAWYFGVVYLVNFRTIHKH